VRRPVDYAQGRLSRFFRGWDREDGQVVTQALFWLECDPSVTDSEQILNIRVRRSSDLIFHTPAQIPAEIFPLADSRARFLCRDNFVPGLHEDVV
jgi:hypothetical protein